LYYLISRTTYFTPKDQGGSYETRYLSNLELWELEQSQARRFVRYPTATLKKLKTQGIEDVQVEEIQEFEEDSFGAKESTPAPFVAMETSTPQSINPSPIPRPVRRSASRIMESQETSSVATQPWRGYVHIGRSTNAEERLQNLKCEDAISFTYYYPSGQQLGQLYVCWYRLKDGRLMPSLEIFGEAWSALGYMWDVVQALASTEYSTLTPEALGTLLEKLNFQDMTQ